MAQLNNQIRSEQYSLGRGHALTVEQFHDKGIQIYEGIPQGTLTAETCVGKALHGVQTMISSLFRWPQLHL